MRYYIKATGSTCYNSTGITFPVKRDIPFEKIIKEHGGTNIEMFRFSSNQPKVIGFALEESKVKPLQNVLSGFYTYLLVLRRN